MLINTNWAEKVVLITGATGGIGSAAAKAFKQESARLAGC